MTNMTSLNKYIVPDEVEDELEAACRAVIMGSSLLHLHPELITEFRYRATPEHILALLEALKQAADWFKEYGDGHAAKGDTDKAKRNYDREAFCRAALRGEP